MAKLPHLRITNTDRSYDYTARGSGGGGEFHLPVRDRASHAAKLRGELAVVEQEADRRGFQARDPRPITYELQPNAIDVIESLERQRSGIELLSVIRKPDRIVASVRVPADKQRILAAVFHRYETTFTQRANVQAIKIWSKASTACIWRPNATYGQM